MRAKHWIVAALLAFLITAPHAVAQKVTIVTVPFDFFVGSTVMPAGDYECFIDQPAAGQGTHPECTRNGYL